MNGASKNKAYSSFEYDTLTKKKVAHEKESNSHEFVAMEHLNQADNYQYDPK
jgi:hypothetical protein